jgi:hypothetical protein
VLQTLRERSQEGLTFRVVRGEWREHADAPHSVRLLGARAASGYAAVPPRAVIIAASQGLRDAPLNHLPLRKGEVAKIPICDHPHKGGDDCISGCQNTKLLQAKNIGCPGCRRQDVEILN